MKDIPKWLAERLSKLRKPVEDDRQNDAESVKPDELDLPKDMQDLVDDVPSPDDVEDDDGNTLPNLSLNGPPSSDADEPTGIDPDDTAKLHKK